MKRERKPADIERGKRLARARKNAGYETAADAVADMDGIDYPSYNNHEAGWRGFRRPKARYYAEFFRVNVDWLQEGIGAMNVKESSARLDLLAGLPSEGQQEAINFIEFLKVKYGV